MEALAAAGEFEPPSLASLEAAQEYGLRRQTGRMPAACRVFADLWDVRRFAGCPVCSEARIARLERMNATQAVPPPVPCDRCGGSAR
jgi:archaeosine synthase beta-subunit